VKGWKQKKPLNYSGFFVFLLAAGLFSFRVASAKASSLTSFGTA
jgi:hypothetical protein